MHKKRYLICLGASIGAMIIAPLTLLIVSVGLIMLTTYQPEEIATQKELRRITKVEFPPMTLGEYVLAENGSGVAYWIAANLEEPPAESFLESIDEQIKEGNGYWKSEDEKYVFHKKGLRIVVKRGESRVWIDLDELSFRWDLID